MGLHGRTTGRVAASERGRLHAPNRRETAAGMVILEEARSGSDVVHAPTESISAPCRRQDVPPITLRAD